MNKHLTIDDFVQRLWEATREFLKAQTASSADAIALAQDSFGELTSRFLAVLLAGDERWPRHYWFDGVAIDLVKRFEPHRVEVVGRVHFARGQDHWFTAPVSFALSAPPDEPLAYRVLFDDLRWESEEDRARQNLPGPTQWRFVMASDPEH